MKNAIRLFLTTTLMIAIFLSVQSITFADGPTAPQLQATATPEATVESTEIPTATVTVETTGTATATVTVGTTETPTATVTIAATTEPTGTVAATETAVVTGTVEASSTPLTTGTGTPGAPQTLPQTGVAPATNDTTSLFVIGGLAVVGIVALGLILGRRTR